MYIMPTVKQDIHDNSLSTLKRNTSHKYLEHITNVLHAIYTWSVYTGLYKLHKSNRLDTQDGNTWSQKLYTVEIVLVDTFIERPPL